MLFRSLMILLFFSGLLGCGVECSSPIVSVRVEWEKSRERLVNSYGGGYIVVVGKEKDVDEDSAISIYRIDYREGELPNYIDIPLACPGEYYIRVKAFSKYLPEGGELSDPIRVSLP